MPSTPLSMRPYELAVVARQSATSWDTGSRWKDTSSTPAKAARKASYVSGDMRENRTCTILMYRLTLGIHLRALTA